MRKTAILMLLPIVALLFGSCSDEDKPMSTAPGNTVDEGATDRAAIPPGSTVESAVLSVYVSEPSGNKVIVSWCWDPWEEASVTWDNYRDSWVPDTVDTFMADGVGWRTVDVASIAQDWVDGVYPNNGLALQGNYCDWPMIGLAAKEGGPGQMPRLDICYTDMFGVSACTTLFAEDDSYIWRAWPFTNFGDEPTMLIGATDSCAPEAVSLVRFDLDLTPPEPASIGDWVWYDLDSNGIQDESEGGVEGVEVKLYTCSGHLQGTDTTDADGYYLFDELEPDQGYYLRFILPEDHVFSPEGEGDDSAADSDVNADGRTECTHLDEGEEDMTWDCGIYVPVPAPASIGDRVWFDLDSNGIQDDGEPGLQGVTVRLFDCSDDLVGVDTTDGDGLYLFDSLSAGQYYVMFEAPTGYEISPQDQGGDDTDSDADPDGRTECTTLAPGEQDMTWDCGLYRPAPPPTSLGNWVWYDGDINGIQNEGEFGVSGVEVNLYTCAGEWVAQTVTDADGFYLFAGLDTGSYFIEFVLPDGWVFTPPGATMDDSKDSDADPNTGRTSCTSLMAGEDDMTWDAGIYEGPCPPSGLLGDRVWFDADQDGIQDDGEPGVGGVQIQLLNCSGAPLGGTFTNDDGYYYFDDLPPGGYMVRFVLPCGYEFSPRFVGSDPSIDSNADPETGLSECVTLQPSAKDSTIDAGIYQPSPEPAGIGDRVWLDMDHDGIQDPNEPGLGDIEVTLYHCGGGVVASTVTDVSGLYSFIDLTPGNYRLEFGLPDGHSFTDRNQGFDDSRDSDVDPATGLTVCTNLQPGEYDDTWDAGIHPDTCPPPVQVGDLVWNDLDRDGIQDPGEPGLSGVTVTLYDCVGAPLQTTTTAADGSYLFSGFNHGSYQIGFEPPDGFTFSPRHQGGDGSVDSDVDPGSGLTECIYFGIGLTDLDLDAGLHQLDGSEVTIGDRVWYDANRNGIQDHGEPGMSMIPVTLYECDGYPAATTFTDSNGYYLFENIPQGHYYVGIDCPHGFTISPQGAGGNPSKDSDVDPETGNGECYWFAPGVTDRSWDAGIHETFVFPVIE